MKRLFRILNVFLLCLAVSFSTNIYGKISNAETYETDKQVRVTIGDSFGKVGGNVSIPVYFDGLPQNGVSAANFIIAFDKDLSLNNVTAGNIIDKSSDFSFSVKDNKLYLLFSDGTGGSNPIKKQGVFCYLNFTVNKNKTNFSISRLEDANEIFVDNDLNKLKGDFKSGNVILKEDLYRVPINKSWKISFNQKLDVSKIKQGIEIKDIRGNSINYDFKLSNEDRTIEILPPKGGYELDKSYIIYINSNFMSKRGKQIKNPYTYYFYVESY